MFIKRHRHSHCHSHSHSHSDNHHFIQRGFRMNYKLQSLGLKLMLMLSLMLLTADNIRPATAESEIHDLNSLDYTRPSNAGQRQTSSKLERYPSYYSHAGFMPPQQYPQLPFAGAPPVRTGGCPLCDSSVYSYCSHKLVHDSCCCDYPGAIIHKPPQCAYFDCALLYAKTCYEHSLIKNCCCNNPY